MNAHGLALTAVTILLCSTISSDAQQNAREMRGPLNEVSRDMQSPPRGYFQEEPDGVDELSQEPRSGRRSATERFLPHQHDDSFAVMERPSGRSSMMRMMMILMDTDANGSVSLQEWQSGQERMFRSMDANNDGNLTLDETRVFRRSADRGAEPSRGASDRR